MKKRTWKKYLTAMLALFLFLTGAGNVLAAVTTGQFLQRYVVDEEKLTVYCSELDSGGSFQVTLGGQEVSFEASTASEIAEPVTVYCLVDVSGTMKDSLMDQVKEVLLTISGNMTEGDNMVIAAFGNTVSSSGLLNTAQEREEAITALERSGEDTNLYAAIVESLNLMATDTTMNARRCLIVLSDGDDEQASGYTESEVEKAIDSSGIPVYTVATLSSSPTTAQQEYGKTLGSFARSSVGGLHFCPAVDNISAADAGSAIWESLCNSIVLGIDLNSVPQELSGNTTILRIVYTTDEAEYEDSIELFTEDILPSPIESEPVPDPDPMEPGPEPGSEIGPEPGADPGPEVGPEPGPDPGPEPDPVEEFPWIVVGVAAAAVIIVAVVVIVLIVKKKKEEKKKNDDETEKDDTGITPPILEDEKPDPKVVSHPVQIFDVPTGPALDILMTELHHGERTVYFKIRESVPLVMGRNPKADVVLDGNDARLSGTHCEIKWENGKVMVCDSHSTNGTFINGVPIRGKGWMPLENGDTLRAGSREYRVNITAPRA